MQIAKSHANVCKSSNVTIHFQSSLIYEDGLSTSMNTMSVSGTMDKTKSSEFNVISKLYNQELKVIANRDPLHDITEQVMLFNGYLF